jgi:hypothetical protein
LTDDRDIETRIRESFGHIPVPERDLPHLVSRSRALRVRRVVAGAVAVSVIGLGIGLPLAALSRLGRGDEGTPSAGPTHAIDLSIQVPDGWDSRLVTQYTGDLALEVANFPLPDDGVAFEDRGWGSISTKDVVLTVVDQTSQIVPPEVDVGEAAAYRDEDFQPVNDPVAFGTEHFGARFEGTQPGHALALRDVRVDGVPLTIWAEFGTDPAQPILIEAVNDILATLDVTAGPAPGPTIGAAPEEGEVGWPPPVFEPAAGWYTATTGAVDPDDHAAPLSWAASVPFSEEDLAVSREAGGLTFYPAGTLRALPEDGVVIIAAIINPGEAPAEPTDVLPDASLPLELADAEVRLAWEGQVAENVPEYVLWRTVDGWQLDVRLYFGTLEPSADTVDAAQDQLSRLQLPARPDGAASIRLTDHDDGVAITLPDDWTFREDPSGPDEPKTVFAAATFDFPAGGECAPIAAQQVLPESGALIWLIEYTDSQGNQFPARPDRFDLASMTTDSFECSVVPSSMLRFQDERRLFQVHVAIGEAAPDSVTSEVEAALDSLEVAPRSTEGCPEGGPWAHPSCPEVGWVRAILADAGYPVVGDTGSALVARADGTGVFIWTTPADEPPSEPFEETIQREGYELYGAVDGVPLFFDGTRIVWTADGLHVWVSAGPSESDVLPDMSVLRSLVRASFRVPYSGA